MITFLITLIYVFTIGGRNPLAVGIKLYVFGLAFSLPFQLYGRIKRKVVLTMLFVIVAFGLFSTFVGNQRDQVSSGYAYIQPSSDKMNSIVLNNFSGIMDYMGAHYSGYQLRRADTFDPQNLGYGIYTFNGLFNFSIPFSSFLGFRGTLGDLLGFPVNELSYYRLAQLNKSSFWTTRSVYIEMICDFGVKGVYIFIFFFTFYTHTLFLTLFSKRFNKALKLLLIYICFTYWASSNFQSAYSNNLLVSFLAFWLFDYFQKWFIKPSSLKVV
jgi:hypothetical protein